MRCLYAWVFVKRRFGECGGLSGVGKEFVGAVSGDAVASNLPKEAFIFNDGWCCGWNAYAVAAADAESAFRSFECRDGLSADFVRLH